jgi:CopG family nickel-responsive transcriptional regulator
VRYLRVNLKDFFTSDEIAIAMGMGRSRIVRFSVSLPSRLVERFGEACRTMGYRSRSKAVHDAISNFISEFEWMREDSGRITGAILVMYYMDRPGLISEISEIKRNFRGAICSTLNMIAGENKCIEIIAVRSKSKEVRELAKALMVKKGVRQVKTALLAL